LTAPAAECKKCSASEAPDPGRHHVGTPGDIISECPGDFVGIRTLNLTRRDIVPTLTATLTTIAFDDSSLQRFEACT
jgi:hypothetical protein